MLVGGTNNGGRKHEVTHCAMWVEHADDEEEDSGESPVKRQRTSEVVTSELLCPITQELFVDPVTAMDGHVYERMAIEKWMANKERVTSPMTGIEISKDLLSAPKVKNIVDGLVKESTIIAQERVAVWRSKHELLEKMRDCVEQARTGDAAKAFWVAKQYAIGNDVTSPNVTMAIDMYTAAAGSKCPRAAGELSSMYFRGRYGCTKNTSLALRWAAFGDGRGCPVSMYTLAEFYDAGLLGIPQDNDEWFRIMHKACNLILLKSLNYSFIPYKLGRAYAVGKKCPVDVVKAVKYMKMSVDMDEDIKWTWTASAKSWLEEHERIP